MKTLVIIPAKDEGAKIGEVVEKIKSLTDNSYDVLVVDDGSKDDTARLAKTAGAFVVRHVINRGQGAAIKTGIEYASLHDYEYVVFFDADGQMAAEEIGSVLKPVLSGQYDVSLGSRFLGRTINMPAIKRITLKLALVFTRLTSGLKLTDTHNGFQAWTLSAIKKVNLTQDRYAYASQILEEIGRLKLKFIEMPVTIRYTDYSKKKGQSVLNSLNIIWDLIIRR